MSKIKLSNNQRSENKESLPDSNVEKFINTQIMKRRLDIRTVKAYSLDLKHLYLWLKEQNINTLGSTVVENYLRYLVEEKKLKKSTIVRKHRVFCCYLEYLCKQKMIQEYCIPVLPDFIHTEKHTDHVLSKAEADAFFHALNQEYDDLDSEFRKLICLRDSIMMELLFYHQIEISELLRLELGDYDRKTGILTICPKKGERYQVHLFSQNLRKQIELLLQEHDYFEHDNSYENRMFLSKLGKPLSMKMVINIFEKYRVKAGIQKAFTPKDLKNSMGQYGAELVMEQCG